jgi:hypothetical protein
MPVQQLNMNPEANLSEGYCIKIEVLKDGFTVSDPLPIEAKSEELDEGEADEYQDSDSELIPDLPTMLKNIMAVIKENPVAGGEEEGFASAGMEKPRV